MNLNRKYNPISSSPNPSCKMYNPIKRSLRPLYTTLLLLTVAGTLAVVIFHLKNQHPPPCTTVSNETLLSHAAVDINEHKSNQEIDYLLQTDFTRLRPFPSISGDRHRSLLISRAIRETLVHVSSNDLHRLWSSFKTSLSEWSTKQNLHLHHPGSLSELLDNVKLSKHLYNTCAVVGNSGILLKTDHGDLIDTHDFVVRLNNAPTSGHNRHVGSKTNLSFINSNVLHSCSRRGNYHCNRYSDQVQIVMYMCQPIHFIDYLLCNASRGGFVVTDIRFDMLCARIAKYYSLRRFAEATGKGVEEWAAAHDGENFHYSSGMQAVMLAVGVCEQVSLFGFGKSEGARHHYHTRQFWELSLHDYEAEYEFYRDLVAGAAVPFVSGEFQFPRVVMYH